MPDYNDIIYNALREGDNRVLENFYNGRFTSILEKVKNSIFGRDVEFNTARPRLFNDLYVYLTDPNFDRLSLYETEGNGDIVTWLTLMAMKYYRNEYDKERKRQKRHYTSYIEDHPINDIEDRSCDKTDLLDIIEQSFRSIKNPRQAEIMRRFPQGRDEIKATARSLGITESSVYTLKQRGVKQFINTYMKLI